MKKSFRKLLSAKNRNNHNETERFSCIIFKKKASIDKVEIEPPKFSKSIKGKRSYYDPNNILRKAVIMNSKKRNIDIIDSKNINNSKNSLSFSVNYLYYFIYKLFGKIMIVLELSMYNNHK